eukprot:GILK01008294.1.p1 GENE.GILK01008294.1~~GILK01008294.1.p1  ORF type:complete len:290 (-),score=37.63 GILK01008294.1:85-912(-)
MSSALVNPSRILPWLFIGDVYAAKDRDKLRSLSIKYILNVTPPRTQAGVPNYFEKDSAFEYRRRGMQDNSSERLSESFSECFEFLERARVREDGNVLVHCQKGVSRSVSIVVAYLMKYKRMVFEEALAFVRLRRPVAEPNSSFVQQLREYDTQLEEERSKLPPTPTNMSSVSVFPSAEQPKKRGRVMGPSLPSLPGPNPAVEPDSSGCDNKIVYVESDLSSSETTSSTSSVSNSPSMSAPSVAAPTPSVPLDDLQPVLKKPRMIGPMRPPQLNAV